jgi:hypothetical protein
MLLFNRLAAAFLLIAALAAPASAQSISSPADQLSSGQYFALVNRVDSFNAAMKANDIASIMGIVPPKVLEKIAANFGVTTADLIAATQQQMDEALKSVTFVSFSMDLENATIWRTADDTPYALIPTETVMDLGDAGGKIRATSSTLGLLDGETWYLVRVEDAQQVAILKEVYPAFANVTFPTGSMEPVTE